ncbi:MAG TPA: ABC transporter ATP-binding protein [Xanthobacteraceae bacterium]|nr:ABC transporter ATP-binding protein [Xanthobacteraceae bacterium]
MLSAENLTSGYGRIQVLHGISIEVRTGEIVSLIGANGAGKSTLLRAISGVQPINGGVIEYEGRRIERMPAHERVALGIAQVPEGRQLIAPLSVEDNLKLGAWSRRRHDVGFDLDRIYALFPVLAERSREPAGTLSGGQQQMLAIGRALMAKPRLLLLDEPSLGLAPMLVKQIFDIISGLRRQGITVLLIEQNARVALRVADRAYVLETGRITVSGSAAQVQSDRRVAAAYLGV